MPYIKQQSRPRYEASIVELTRLLNENTSDDFPGHLNYVISSILNRCKTDRYKDLNELVGVLECIKLEFYRRIGSELEDRAIERNGDIYDLKGPQPPKPKPPEIQILREDRQPPKRV